ncbi:hypothetical protein ACFOHK_00355 [Falsigemmobacter intermedius]|uniref:hypothetical protein n=1 Tax=Falsigemmobacter intermedius TaxID=1553448 RepID=UPI0035EBA2A4
MAIFLLILCAFFSGILAVSFFIAGFGYLTAFLIYLTIPVVLLCWLAGQTLRKRENQRRINDAVDEELVALRDHSVRALGCQDPS